MSGKIYLLLLLLLFWPLKVYACDETYISDSSYKACIEYGEEYNICPELLMAIIEKESGGQADAENGSCKGLMQINVDCHTERMEKLGCIDIFDEKQNIHVAADYLAELSMKYEDVCLVLMCYNMGESGASELFDRGIYSSEYAVKICERAEELERQHGK